MNLGRIVKNSIIALIAYSGIYIPIEAHLTKDGWLQTNDKKQIFPVGENSILRGKNGEPSIAIVNSRSQYTQSPALLVYELCLYTGENQAGDKTKKYHDLIKRDPFVYNKVKHGMHFPDIDRARLWFDEYVYVPNCGRDSNWKDQEKKRIYQAEGMLMTRERTTENTQTEAPVSPDAGATMTISKTLVTDQYPDKEMSDREYMEFMQEIQIRIIEWPLKILPIEINGETITLQHLERFNESVSPAILWKKVEDNGIRIGRDENPMSAINAILPVVLIIVALCVGMPIAYAIIKSIH